ncbi:MAG: hypothetical protein P794_01505 [Epsilonproteobacteria bacterium (ex Lamellibrachia satsuma)]|nr:MAG: hypothetical protein P794_01505 [Epsilonproteobacteria bacterium (ex Lamellibrachia satsuma)]
MSRYKLTDEMLQDIEDYAEDQYTLEDTFDELNISKKLMKDERVLQAFEKGLIKLYISMASSGMSNVDIVDDFEININQCALWHEKYSDEIKQAKQKIADDKKLATRQFSDPLISGLVNIMTQNGTSAEPISQKVLHDDIEKIIEKTKAGDTEALITILTTNIMQLQLFNGRVAGNLMGEAGKQLNNFEKLSNMQIKVMQETRKSIMAINEIINPKRATFIKKAEQHNHLHQNSEKKGESKNEKQKELTQPDQITEAELCPLKEKACENK